ncbi:glucose-1-phosphate adenylyltransferase subunit GlgD [Oceanirhabdus sp. W0125-5]|uniref:glucose-1-phosphate adenylyltransferase subunit GlgD n=1 Tax=Oceanirhabdus sp. W0125-5 TaxID=2999116 RepID=UPI0022F2A564|nr:glucose-1-phosphate adenylyltransferase subunit GlgD [Oceanirhabdus sp. W0125-5]WBW97147.1 glucose-1-phosphate adenylyltransferase subunit GlgD [Oceanirhabdus sp. W0125-5]
MQDIMGIINLSEQEDQIRELTYNRPIATIPIGGKYRVIDFTLSNMVNSGMINVAVFTQGKCRSLMEHLRVGKEWDLDRKKDGLFIMNPVINPSDTLISKGDIKNFKDHIEYIERSRQKYVLLSKSYMICNVNYEEAFKYHKESNADITILYKNVDDSDDSFLRCDTLNLDNDRNVISIGRNVGNNDSKNISMEMYIMKKSLLIEIIQSSITIGENLNLKDAVFDKINRLNVNAYPFEGYLSCVNSMENYYKTNMELLDINVSHEVFNKNGGIYTKIKDEAPTKYAENSHVKNSVIANGCIIEGTVENSIISRGVRIRKGAVVKDSVIMAKGTVEEDTVLKHAILDKYVHISRHKVLCGDSKKPIILGKNFKL